MVFRGRATLFAYATMTATGVYRLQFGRGSMGTVSALDFVSTVSERLHIKSQP